MKISNLRIESFRGIPNELDINFKDTRERPVSTLIYGDNGSGKSSIIDALEFNLQGKIERSDSIKNEFRPSPLSWNKPYDTGAKTTVFFDDKSNNKRNIVVSFDNEQEKFLLNKSNKELHPNFQIAPIVLRRSDIINYATTPVQRKQVLFWSFIYKTSSGQEANNINDKVLIQNLEKDRISIKTKRRKINEELAETLKITESDIPTKKQEILSFIKKNIRKGFTNKQYEVFKHKGTLKGINEKAIKLSEELLKVNEEVLRVQSKIGKLKKINSPSNEIRKDETRKFLKMASSHLTKAFRSISTSEFVEEINVKIGELTEVSFEIEVKLTNGKITSPSNIFSEANLDLLILLLYTSLIKESSNYGQAKLIVLDDVLQSVDSTIRLNFLEYLLQNFKDWQIIISAHDRLWFNQLRNAFRRNQHSFKEIEIFQWDFQLGPQLIEPQAYGAENALAIALETNNIQLIASQSGLLLESICQNLSINLETSIHRKKDDKYTIGDLWPGIKKYFKKSELLELTIEIDKRLYIRNLLGAHYNEWAISMSNEEVLCFARLVNKFYSKIFCENCRCWISEDKSCKCEALIIK